MTDELVEHDLRQIALFADLSAVEMADVVSLARVREIDKDAFYFMQGDQADAMFVLRQGTVKLFQLTPDGHQVLLRLIGPGSLFAVIAMVEGSIYPITAQASRPSQALYWGRAEINQLVERIPRLSLNAMKLMSEMVHEYQTRIKELATEQVERRLARALLRLANQTGRKTTEGVLINLPLTRQDLAEMTGTTLYTVSRILSQWEQKNIILSRRERITICFPHGLVKIADDL